MRSISIAFVSLALVACGDGTAMPDTDAGPEIPTTLRDGAEVTYAPVYQAVSYQAGLGGATREWLPKDLAVHPGGELWVVQQMERDPAFDDESECTSRGLSGAPNDCVSQQGSTVAITNPTAAEPATGENGRANLVVDANAWHFMRRPSSIAFGAAETTLNPDDPGAEGAGLTAPITFTNTFATCHEHWTGNPTDSPPFIGPTLWTADPAIYNGENGSFEWSNGSHLDMVHATQYCMGIAHERENVYWTFNGEEGALDRYDFGKPHFQGHHDHSDGDVERYYLADGDGLSRLPYVPSNMVIHGTDLFVADTGNGRVVRFDLSSEAVEMFSFRTFENIDAAGMVGLGYEVVLDADTLGAEWGGESEPSGLTVMDDGTLVVANHATGHISLFELDGTLVRTLDTGFGAGLGGLTALDGALYFVQMNERLVYRVDAVVPTEM